MQLDCLDKILQLRAPSATSVNFIIVIDNPAKADEVSRLKAKYEHLPEVRIRENRGNLGASLARNKGISESAAEWVFFLDDDVEPSPDLLDFAALRIHQDPTAAGFVGSTSFPDPAKHICKAAIVFSGVTFFWGAASLPPGTFREDLMPWGVTANLLVRRAQDGVWFDGSFPKTGGGEDIDFCLRKCRALARDGLVAAPDLRAVHPWWNNVGPRG